MENIIKGKMEKIIKGKTEKIIEKRWCGSDVPCLLVFKSLLLVLIPDLLERTWFIHGALLNPAEAAPDLGRGELSLL
jgi:hypothetical protein